MCGIFHGTYLGLMRPPVAASTISKIAVNRPKTTMAVESTFLVARFCHQSLPFDNTIE